jgi:hypothetical protein
MLETLLIALLVLFAIQSLARFLILWPLVPYEKRIKRIASYYAKDHRVIAWYDNVMLIVILVMVALLFATQMQVVSFVTGLTVGMLLIQLFFHRFTEPLPPGRMPDTPIPPVKLVSYAIQERPGRAWREIAFITALFGWALVVLVGTLLGIDLGWLGG